MGQGSVMLKMLPCLDTAQMSHGPTGMRHSCSAHGVVVLFGNDPHSTAADFREALETEYSGSFSDIVFAITDWSTERRFLGPFRKVFSSAHP